MRKVIILALLLIATSFAGDVTWQEQTCSNSTHLLTHNFIDNSTDNITTSYVSTPCAYGCDNQSSTCFNPTNDRDFLFLPILGLGILSALALVIVKITDADKTWIKMLFLFVALYAQFYLIGLTASFGERYAGVASATAKGVLTFSWVYAGLILFIVVMFIFQIIFSALEDYKNHGKQE